MLVRHGGCRAGLQRDCSQRQGLGPSDIAHVFGETTGSAVSGANPRTCCDVSVSWATSKWEHSLGIFNVFVLGKRCGVACATAVRRKPPRDGGRLWTRHSEGSTQRWSGPTVPGAVERKCNLLTVLVATTDRQRKERG